MSAPEVKTARPELDEGDHERFAHYVRKDDHGRGYIEGQEITALCGKRWVPFRDPSLFPVCPSCLELLAQIKAMGQ